MALIEVPLGIHLGTYLGGGQGTEGSIAAHWSDVKTGFNRVPAINCAVIINSYRDGFALPSQWGGDYSAWSTTNGLPIDGSVSPMLDGRFTNGINSDVDFAGVVAGTYDAPLRAALNLWKSAGNFNTIYIRMNWEFNTDFLGWGVPNSGQVPNWIACWKHWCNTCHTWGNNNGINIKMVWAPDTSYSLAESTSFNLPVVNFFPIPDSSAVNGRYIDVIGSDIYMGGYGVTSNFGQTTSSLASTTVWSLGTFVSMAQTYNCTIGISETGDGTGFDNNNSWQDGTMYNFATYLNSLATLNPPVTIEYIALFDVAVSGANQCTGGNFPNMLAGWRSMMGIGGNGSIPTVMTNGPSSPTTPTPTVPTPTPTIPTPTPPTGSNTYNIALKRATDSTFGTLTTRLTSPNYTFTGLSSATTYDYEISVSMVGVGTSAYATGSFTTLSATESPIGTQITSAGPTITDAAGNTWSLVANPPNFYLPALNGTIVPGIDTIIDLTLGNNGQIYALNYSNNLDTWYVYNNGTWSVSGSPTTPSPTVPTPTVPTIPTPPFVVPPTTSIPAITMPVIAGETFNVAIRRAIDPTFDTIITGITAEEYTFNNLTPDTVYIYEVSVSYGGAEGDFVTGEFSTLPVPTPVPTVPTPGITPGPDIILTSDSFTPDAPAGTTIGLLSFLISGTPTSATFTVSDSNFNVFGPNLVVANPALDAGTYPVTVTATYTAPIVPTVPTPTVPTTPTPTPGVPTTPTVPTVPTPTVPTPTGTRNWYDNPGQDGSMWVQPFYNTAQWDTSSAAHNQLFGSTATVNQWGNWSAPLYVGNAGDPTVTVTDGSHSITVHLPAGVQVEQPTSQFDQSIGGMDRTKPYLLWNISGATIDGSPQGTVRQGSVIRGTYGFSVMDGTGLILEDAVTGTYSQNAMGNIQEYELLQATLSNSYVMQHMLCYQIPAFMFNNNHIWPLSANDTNGSGLIPEGTIIGIPPNISRPAGRSRGFNLLFDNLQQYGWICYNVSGTPGINIMVASLSSGTSALATDIANSLNSVLTYGAILTNQTGPGSIKGYTFGASSLYPPPPLLDFSPTGGVPVLPSSFGAWYPGGYNLPSTG